ncbi:MAG: complex regulator protein [Parcubacteria group bacterium Gr01-1014_48]|nr:MAG: complex regulator protein [Parcubacteria group bacterium Greene0416_14]TSC74610.1 MAG: complex regulator protein [Parcubacteria group bacterium Gr01-1014_48]TSD01591.1 MAG: complex regulator protein [Parcubacteria group bacterium Greene1014_15]TSD08360.1 MAG: complex regulator protein [Parcubacteria group bacterium Greene0714_4]
MKKILVIEDNAIIVRILQQRMPNLEFSIAVHPAESVTKATEEKPDLILLDLMLPERSGFDILRDLQEKKETKKIPIIVMSALGSEEDIERATKLGALDYIVKGMESIDTVVEKLKKVLGEELIKKSPTSHRQISQKTKLTKKETDTGRKKKVLFVEDDLFLVHAYQDILEEDRSILVWIAQDGDEAIAYLKKQPPDLVLLDLLLPGKSGFEVLAAIRKHPVWKSVPVIILSNLGQPQDVEKAMKLGVTDYIIKANTKISDVAARIEKFLT